MKIKEGSKLEIIECNNERDTLIDGIIANNDIEIEGNGAGYAILLRNDGYDKNCIFESDKIEQDEKGVYQIYGYFKDALLVIENKSYNAAIFDSYMDYDS